MAKKVLIPVIGVLLLVCVGLASVAVYVYTQMISPPYVVQSERMTKDYLKQLKTIGEYQIITGVESNPLESDTELIVYYSKTGKQTGAASENFVAVGSGTARLEEILGNIDESECNPRSQTSGTIGSVGHYYGTCGRSSYYIYRNNQDWIVFNAEDGMVGLQAMVEEYIK